MIYSKIITQEVRDSWEVGKQCSEVGKGVIGEAAPALTTGILCSRIVVYRKQS